MIDIYERGFKICKKNRHIFNKILVVRFSESYYYEPSEKPTGYHHNSYSKHYNEWDENLEINEELLFSNNDQAQVI